MPKLTSTKLAEADAIVASIDAGIVEKLRALAPLYKELLNEGIDLTKRYNRGYFAYLAAISDGRVDAELVVKFGHKQKLMGAIIDLVPEVQAKFINQDSVALLVYENDAEVSKQVPIDILTSKQIDQVFRGPDIRRVPEQKPFLKMPPERRTNEQVHVNMTPEQRKKLQAAATKAGVSSGQLLLDAAIKLGIL